MAAAAYLSTPAPPLPECHDAPSYVLLDARPYIDDRGRRNATTAKAVTASGQPIEVTFYTARPPLLSHFCVHCPGLRSDDFGDGPKVVAADADLVLFHVSLNGRYTSGDYFVYRAHTQRPSLDLLPPPPRSLFVDGQVALLRRRKGDYIVAALQPNDLHDNEMEFVLDLYRRKGKSGWSSKLLSVEEPLRDTVCPAPTNLDDPPLYHETWKTITLAGGMVGWVDLWRGILLCNVLDENPVLRDMPLPLPARGNWTTYLIGCPYLTRDIAVSQDKKFINYIEMEIRPSRKVTTRVPASYQEWVRQKSCAFWVRDGWKATTWSMPIPVCSWDDWHLDYSVDVADLTIGNSPEHSMLLPKLSSGKEVTKATLGRLFMAYPTISLDDGILYLCSGPKHTDLENMIAVDMKKKILKGVAKLDLSRNFLFKLGNTLFAANISKYLDKREAHTQTVAGSQKMASEKKRGEKDLSLR